MSAPAYRSRLAARAFSSPLGIVLVVSRYVLPDRRAKALLAAAIVSRHSVEIRPLCTTFSTPRHGAVGAVRIVMLGQGTHGRKSSRPRALPVIASRTTVSRLRARICRTIAGSGDGTGAW